MKAIELRGKLVAIVDDDSFLYLAQYRWSVDAKGYAYRYAYSSSNQHGVKTRMHRVVIAAETGQIVDHINGNKLDNRRCNLRFATNAQNRANSRVGKNSKSGFKCVFRQGKKWRAYINSEGKRTNLGYYDSPEAAHAAYCLAATQKHGEFARFN